MALFQNEQSVNDFLNWRKDAYHEIAKNKSQATIDSKATKLKERFSASITLGIDQKYVDFGVSHNRAALLS